MTLKFRKFRKYARRRRSTAYYVALILSVALACSTGILAISGGGLLPAEDAAAMHQSELVVEHDDEGGHKLTWLGVLIFGRPAYAHKVPYCGHGSIYPTINGSLHKVQFRWHYANGDHRVRSAHYMFTGTGYTRITAWDYYRVDC